MQKEQKSQKGHTRSTFDILREGERTIIVKGVYGFWTHISSVADPHRKNADADPGKNLSADADPDADADPGADADSCYY
jgi:hypothetical protein